MIMPQKSFGSAMELAVNALQQNPDLDYQTVKEMASASGMNLPPILYGRARQQLGLPSLRTPPPRPAPAPIAPPTRAPIPAGASMAEMGAGVAAAFAPADEPADEADEPIADEPAAAPYDPQIDMVAPKKSGSPSFDFALQVLRQNPNIAYRDLKTQMDEKGFNFPPIVFGRAKAVLGLVPVKPRGSKKAAAAAAKAAMPAAPLQLRQVESVAADSFAKKLDEVRNLDQVVGIVRELEAERRRLRLVLEQVIDILDSALS